jgi:hypothetical protein
MQLPHSPEVYLANPTIARHLEAHLHGLVAVGAWDDTDVIWLLHEPVGDCCACNVRHWTAEQFKAAGIDFAPPAHTAPTACM